MQRGYTEGDGGGHLEGLIVALSIGSRHITCTPLTLLCSALGEPLAGADDPGLLTAAQLSPYAVHQAAGDEHGATMQPIHDIAGIRSVRGLPQSGHAVISDVRPWTAGSPAEHGAALLPCPRHAPWPMSGSNLAPTSLTDRAWSVS
jgi:hypothetical protein